MDSDDYNRFPTLRPVQAMVPYGTEGNSFPAGRDTPEKAYEVIAIMSNDAVHKRAIEAGSHIGSSYLNSMESLHASALINSSQLEVKASTTESRGLFGGRRKSTTITIKLR